MYDFLKCISCSHDSVWFKGQLLQAAPLRGSFKGGHKLFVVDVVSLHIAEENSHGRGESPQGMSEAHLGML